MILIRNVNLPLSVDFSDIKSIVAKELSINENEIISSSLFRKSVDARKKDNIFFCCSFVATLSEKIEKKLLKTKKNVSVYKREKYVFQRNVTSGKRPVVVGFGPAGMFASLLLARSGLRPIVIERGEDADNRKKSVEAFFNGEKLNIQSNIQFGEGGAGTFSDGKLNTGTKDIRQRTVLETFYEFGAKENILYDANPHIGTDILIDVVKNIRKEIISLGGTLRFSTLMESIDTDGKSVKAVILSDGERIETDRVILAIGHSARDTFTFLKNKGISMEKKAFSVGVRIEHLQEDINKALYGSFYDRKELPAASYKLAVHLDNGRGVYTFCMCPGGEVVNASSEENKIAVNGMSYNARNNTNANSAVLVGVTPDDYADDDVLAGMHFQRKIEENAFRTAFGSVPITTVGNLLYGDEAKIGKIKPTVKPNTAFCDLYDIFPDYIVQSLKEGIIKFDGKLKGFADKEAIITAPETRSSSPVRILRNEKAQSLSLEGLFPCGEGAGYAGGIVSAAVDGLYCGEKLIESL